MALRKDTAMILAIDVGNSNTVIDSYRCQTNINEISGVLEQIHKDNATIRGAILSSVVPSINSPIFSKIKQLWGIETMLVSPFLKMNITIPERYRAEIGGDIITGCVAAVNEYQAPLAVIDMGTCTTVMAIDKNKEFRCGTIHPGIKMELNDLSKNTAQLPSIAFETPNTVLANSTEECMRAGVLYGHAGMIDTILTHMEKELGYKLNAVITGGLCKYVAPLCQHELIVDEELLIKGLKYLWETNN